MIQHLLEGGVVSSTVWLAYVTQFPYHVRRRHTASVVRVFVLCRQRVNHHWRWVLWQVTIIIPAPLRRTRRKPGEEE